MANSDADWENYCSFHDKFCGALRLRGIVFGLAAMQRTILVNVARDVHYNKSPFIEIPIAGDVKTAVVDAITRLLPELAADTAGDVQAALADALDGWPS